MFLLVHKMDLLRENAGSVLAKKSGWLEQESGDIPVTVFGMSIYNGALQGMASCLSALVGDAELLHSRRGLGSSTACPERQHPVKASVDVGAGVQHNGGCSIRTDDIPRRHHAVRSRPGERRQS